LVSRPNPRNCYGDFAAQITKLLTLGLRPKPRSHQSGFEVKPLRNRRHWFLG
jgi:hypothetical protein